MMRLALVLAFAGCAPHVAPPPGPVAPDTAYVLLSPRPASPTPLHLAVRQMVGMCAGAEQAHGPVGLATADSIIGLPSGNLAYGIGGSDADGALIIIDAAFFHNAAVVSHEMLHVLHRAGETSRIMMRCTLYVGVDMPIRTVVDPQRFVYRGTVLRFERSR